MQELGIFLHVFSIVFCVAATSLGVGIGGGLCARSSLHALNIAPAQGAHIIRATIIGLALLETGGILGIVMGLMMLFGQPVHDASLLYIGISECGIALALGIPGCLVGAFSALPSQQAAIALTRQPFASSKIINIMLLTQSLVQTPAIFGFLISLFIKNQLYQALDLATSMRLLASGLCLGIGSIGPIIGLARFAGVAVKSIGFNRHSYSKIMPFSFISQAIIETPVIFAFVISMILLATSPSLLNSGIHGLGFLAAALAIGIGTFGPGISSGAIASAACQEIAADPKNSSILIKTSILGQGLVDAAAIYALLISLLLLLLR
jgi:F-type H+-transporting ATPase subunit c